MTILKTIGKRIAGDSAWFVLLAVAMVGAWLYVQFQQERAARDRVEHAAEVICAGSGTAFAEKGGKDCARRVADLAGFKAQVDERTAATLAKALADHDARQNTDTEAARRAAEAARTAAERMEMADAKAEERKNLVDREWFASVNGVAGLRASR